MGYSADVAMQVVQVHKDGAASTESPHQQVFTASKSVDIFAHLLRMLRPTLQAKMRGTVSVPTGASKVQQTILRHDPPHFADCTDCGLVLGIVWKTLEVTVRHVWFKQQTICKRWFTFHWCHAFHHHFAEGQERAQKLMLQLLLGPQDCTERWRLSTRLGSDAKTDKVQKPTKSKNRQKKRTTKKKERKTKKSEKTEKNGKKAEERKKKSRKTEKKQNKEKENEQ